MAFNTGNPVPSTDGRDLSDNAEIIDGFANSTAASINDRLGVPRRTLSKINSQVLELEAQYVFTAINNGVWAAGQKFTALNQYMVFSDKAYKPKNTTSLPYVVGATPVGDNNVEVVGNLSTAQGDARYERQFDSLADAIAALGTKNGDTFSIKGRKSEGDGGAAEWRAVLLSNASVLAGAPGYGFAVEWGGNTGAGTDLALVITPKGSKVTSLQYGLFGDSSGVPGTGTDDAPAANALIQYGFNFGPNITWDDKAYRTASTIIIDRLNLTMDSEGDARFVPDDANLVGVRIGNLVGGQGGKLTINRLKVDRNNTNVATENIGFEYIACSQSSFNDLESRRSKYNHKIAPTADGFANNVFNNLQGIGHERGLWMEVSGTGFANSNKFFGGRMFNDGNTKYPLYLQGLQVNDNLITGMNLEGEGISAIFCNAFQNRLIQLRLEGTWSTADVEFGPISTLNTFEDTTQYSAVVIDNSVNQDNKWRSRGGNRDVLPVNATQDVLIRSGTSGDKAVRVIGDESSSGNSYCLELRHSRDLATSFAWKSIRSTDELVRSSLTGDGRLTVARQFVSEQGGFVFNPLVLGTANLHVDGGLLRKKQGSAPGSTTDGAVMLENQTAVAAAFQAIGNVVNTTDKYVNKMVGDTGIEQPLWTWGTAASATWDDAAGVVVYTPV